MTSEIEIASVLGSKYVPKVGKYIVKLGFVGERAREFWMSGRQLANLENNFARTPHGHSTQRAQVIGVLSEKGYYMYSKLEETDFIEPEQLDLSDLNDD